MLGRSALIAICWLFFAGDPAAEEHPILRRARAIEMAEEAKPGAETPSGAGPDWTYLRALAALTHGDRVAAEAKARELSGEGDPRGSLLEEFLGQLRGAGPSTRESELWESEPWSSNPSWRRAWQLLRWSRHQRGERWPELSFVLRVQHFGPWPDRIAGSEFLAAEPEEPAERLQWLNRGRGSLLGRLNASSTRGPLVRRTGGRWILITLLRSDASLEKAGQQARRLGELLGEETPLQLWVLELDDPAPRELVKGVGSISTPLFVATTRSSSLFLTPGFEGGGVHVLLDPELRIRLVVDRWLPLPVVHPLIKETIGGS